MTISEEILVNITPQETRVAIVENGALQEVCIERQGSRGIVGNIYKGKVNRVLPGMEAAFIDIGLVKAGFAELAAEAKAKGVILGLEPIHPADILTKGCINSIAHALEIIDPHPNAKLILDVYHSWWDPDFPRLLREAPEKVAVVQVSNLRIENGQPAGRDNLASGALDMPRFIAGLLSGNYRGPFEFELFPGDVGERDVRSLIAAFPREFADCVAAA